MEINQSIQTEEINRVLGCFIGGIVGDAYGASYEFKSRDEYEVSPNMEETVFGCPPGSFTDDSSMMLCLAVSLLYKKRFDPIDQMETYIDWWQKGYLSSDVNRGCFDIGRTTSRALATFIDKYEIWKRSVHNGINVDKFNPYIGSTDPYNSGNGGIMRLAPVPIVYRRYPKKAKHYSILSSMTTHGSQECIDAAAFMCDVLLYLFNGGGQHDRFISEKYSSENVNSIANKEYINKSRDDILTSGYVIHTLEAAMWAFENSKTFEDGMMMLAKMGGDTDTVCCVYGQIAGAYYGFNAIPQRWVSSLQRQDLIFSIAHALICNFTVQ
jgi:ADP-ribosyl-[dinitrogen reductase] hydrolase